MRQYLTLENSIYLTVFLLPLYLIRFDFFIFPTNLLEILLSIIFLTWLFSRKTTPIWPEIYIRNKFFLGGFFLIFSGFLISALLSDSWKIGLGIIKSWLCLPVLFVFLARILVPKEKLEKIWKVYYLSSFFIAAISLTYLVLGKITYDGRLSGFYNSPNYLAMQLAPALIIGIFLFFSNSSTKLKKYFLIFSLFIILGAFYATHSYAAWLAVLFSLALALLFRRALSLKKIFLIFSILVLLFFSQIKNPKLSGFLDLAPRSSATSRLIIWKASGKILANHWLLGIGPGNFQKNYLGYQKYFSPYLEWAVPHPHNIYLSFWLSGGLLALIGFFILIFFYLRETFRQNSLSFFSLASLGIMLYILGHGFFDTTYFKNDLAIVFWLCFLSLLKFTK